MHLFDLCIHAIIFFHLSLSGEKWFGIGDEYWRYRFVQIAVGQDYEGSIAQRRFSVSTIFTGGIS